MLTKQQLDHFTSAVESISNRTSQFPFSELSVSDDAKQVFALNQKGDSVPVAILPSFPYDSSNQQIANFIASSPSDMKQLLSITQTLLTQYTNMEQGLIESMRLQKTEFDAIAQIQSKIVEATSMLEGMKKLLINTNEFANSKFNK